MTGHGAKFGRMKEAAVAALLAHPNHEAAARAVEISAKTLGRWLQDPTFQEAYREARRAAFAQNLARLQQATAAAVTTMLKTMIDANTPAASRVRAAATVVNLNLRAMEIEDVAERVTKLEQAIKRLDDGSQHETHEPD